MSEYWKSTPKYWCKHCSTYVKDTPFERKQHENTGKHQGNLKRFLHGIQKDHEKNEREKERAKTEVDRLNRVVGGQVSSSGSSTSKPSPVRKSAASAPSAVDQKRQWAQLAEMGIQVPENFRAEMAMSGQWQTIATTSHEPVTTEGALSVGVRKRKLEEQEDEEGKSAPSQRRGWGTTTRRYPGQDDSDLEALLNGPLIRTEKPFKVETKQEQLDSTAGTETGDEPALDQKNAKIEYPEDETPEQAVIDNALSAKDQTTIKDEDVKLDGQAASTEIAQEPMAPVFKKRKVKPRAGKETG